MTHDDASSNVSPPKRLARLAGLLYLVPTFLGPFSLMYVPSVLVVPNDATATASRVLGSEALLRLGVLSDVLIVLSELALTAALYALLAPAGRVLARTAAYARVAMAVLQAVNVLPSLAALGLAESSIAERSELVLLLFETRALGEHVWVSVFALHCALVSVLVARSGYLPRVLGFGMGLASIGYAASGLGNLVAPDYAPLFEVIVAITAIVGEVPFVVWLVWRGVDAARADADHCTQSSTARTANDPEPRYG
jgi:hypothetical protein